MTKAITILNSEYPFLNEIPRCYWLLGRSDHGLLTGVNIDIFLTSYTVLAGYMNKLSNDLHADICMSKYPLLVT